MLDCPLSNIKIYMGQYSMFHKFSPGPKKFASVDTNVNTTGRITTQEIYIWFNLASMSPCPSQFAGRCRQPEQAGLIELEFFPQFGPGLVYRKLLQIFDDEEFVEWMGLNQFTGTTKDLLNYCVLLDLRNECSWTSSSIKKRI